MSIPTKAGILWLRLIPLVNGTPKTYRLLTLPSVELGGQIHAIRRFVRDPGCFIWSWAVFLGGQVLLRIIQGRINRRHALEHMVSAGPGALSPVLLTNLFAGMIFTVQTARELDRFGALHALGGAFALAFCRELAPILTAAILAGQVGTAFAAEIGCMKVTDQIDALKVLRTDPVDYLVVPRVVACCIMLPVLTVMGLVVGILAGATIAQGFYQVPMSQFLDSVRSLLILNDLIAVLIKSLLFGAIVAPGWLHLGVNHHLQSVGWSVGHFRGGYNLGIFVCGGFLPVPGSVSKRRTCHPLTW